MLTYSSADEALSDKERYILLEKQMRSLINGNDHYLSSLSNFTALLKQTLKKISWIGFYLYDGEKLYLGPFQGKIACTEIALGKGVCGTAAEKRETIIVPDVDKFPGHIVCDADSKSEIVIPLLKNDELKGVLDVDSNQFEAFNEVDKEYLEQFCYFIISETGI